MRQPVPFGKYLLLDRISVGGMAEVFKAKSYGVEGFEKVIAIKRILPSMGEDKDFIKMFIDEAKIAGQLSHANICQIFELGKISGSHFIAMEYIWGKDLLQIQNRSKRMQRPVPVAMACFVIAEACEGLHHAHKKRDALGSPLEIVHRDCSPQNILVSYEGEVKVIDFGIARAASRSSRTQAGVLKGKFSYMSPEQVRGLPLDRRSDIFSLGTVLYETLTGERLFAGESDFSTLERVRNADVLSPRDLNSDIPEEVERICMKALARDRDERYQWASEMQADLQAYLTAQSQVFSSKSLGEVVRDLFAEDLAREKQQMERYKRVGRDGLIVGVPQAKAKLAIDEELGEAPPLEGDPTTLGGPDFDDIIDDDDGGAAAAHSEPLPPSLAAALELAEEIDETHGFDDKPTEIHGETIGQSPSPHPGDPSSRPTTALPAAPVPISPQALSPRPFAPGTAPPGPANQPPPPGYAPGPHGHGAAAAQAVSLSYPRSAYPVTAPNAAPPRRRSAALRDIAIGVGIAAVVLALFAVGRQMFAGDDGEGEETAAKAVAAVDAAVAPPTPADAAVAATPVDAALAATASPDAAAVETPDAAPVDRAAEREAAEARRAEREARRREREQREKERREKERRDKERRDKEKAEADKQAKNVGYLIANSTPFARVVVDGRNTGKMTPMGAAEKIALPAGHHTVTFVVGDKKFRFGVTIKAGKTRTLYRALHVE